MASAMAEDHRETLRMLESRNVMPEYNLSSINQSLESMQDPLNAIMKIAAARKKRLAEEQHRKESNRRLQDQLAKKHDRLVEEQEQKEQDQLQDVDLAVVVKDEDSEPAVTEALCLVPQQHLPAVDLAPLDLPAPTGPEAAAMLQQLLATRQLFAFVGAFDAESSSPVLKVLFQVVSYDDSPYGAYQQLVQHYNEADAEDMGWVPALSDFLTAVTMLGYQPLRGHSGGGGRKRSAGEGAPQGADATGGSGGGGASGEAGGCGDAGPSGQGARFGNLQCLLRLLTELVRLHQKGRVDLGFGSQEQAVCKSLMTMMLRMLLDPDLTRVLYADVRTSLEALMQPWDETVWRRVGDDTAQQAAELGPSHRGAYHLIWSVQGLSGRLRSWQQCAAMQLLRKALPQGMAGGGGGQRRGQAGVDLRELRALLGQHGSVAKFKDLTSGLTRSRDKMVDYWRLLTVLQCMHLVVWGTAYTTESEETEEIVRWISSYFKSAEQSMRGQQPTVMRIKVFLADALSNYDVACAPAE